MCVDDVIRHIEGKSGRNFILVWLRIMLGVFFHSESWLNWHRFARKTLLVFSEAIDAVTLLEFKTQNPLDKKKQWV